MANTGGQHQWVRSEGGPLIAVPESAVHQWGGAAATYPADSPDYDRACSVDEEIGWYAFRHAFLVIDARTQVVVVHLDTALDH